MIDLHEITKKLVGPINPIGESRTDEIRFENLKEVCGLVEALLSDIDKVIPNKRRQEGSMMKAGEYADRFFTLIWELRSRLGVYIGVEA